MEATASPENDGPARHVFGDGGPALGEDELASIAKALSELVVPLQTGWCELLGREVVVTISDVGPGPSPRPVDAEPDPTASLLDGLSGPDSFIAIGAFGGELGTAAVIVPTALGLVVVDVLLGGTGRPSGDRSLSAIDLDLLTTITRPTFTALRRLGAPERVDEPVELLVDLEEPDLSSRLASGVRVTVMITVGEHTEPLLLILAPVAAGHLAGSAVTAPTDAPAEQNRALLESVLADVIVEAVIAFPSIQVPSHRILGLDIGDVIGLGTDTGQSLPLRVDGLHLADVRPARSGNDVACQIITTAVGTAGTRPHSSPAGTPAPGGLL